MNNIDLNIDNYELSDILKLFNISYNFNKEDLKKCKKYVLKTHPDKSDLPQEYFLFFSQAYKLLYEIYNFKSKQDNCPTQYKDILNDDIDSNKKIEYINKITKNNDFNHKFNNAFTKNNITTEFTKTGYTDWLKTSKQLNIKQRGDANNSIEQYKNSQIIEVESIQNMELNNYSDIDGVIPNNYAAPIFSKLNYDDIKKAHSESIIPVSHKDMPTHQVNTVEELQNIRSHTITMPSLEQSKQLLDKKKTVDNHISTVRAYNLAKQGIDAKKSVNKFNTMFNRLNYIK